MGLAPRRSKMTPANTQSHAMSSPSIQCLQQVLTTRGRNRLNTHPQLEVAVFPKQPKVHTKVMNVPTVVHVMVKVVYVHVTKVTLANPAKHKQFWFKFAKKTSLNSKQKEMCFTFAEQYVYIKLISKSDSHYELIIKKVLLGIIVKYTNVYIYSRIY